MCMVLYAMGVSPAPSSYPTHSLLTRWLVQQETRCSVDYLSLEDSHDLVSSQLSRLSLARERRRRNRQEQSPGGRIVLRSRSNESLPQQHQPPLLVEQQGKVKDEAPSSSQVLAQDQQHEEHEEEEKVICLLDTTLHLAEPSRKSRDAVTPLAREAFVGTSVKLRERSKSLRESVQITQ